MKLKRGQKLCKHCNNINGARARICKHCNTEFEIRGDLLTKIKKNRNKNLTTIDWKTLNTGDEIYFRGRSGTYFLNYDGTRDYTTDKGVYRVVALCDEGFMAYGKRGNTFFTWDQRNSASGSLLCIMHLIKYILKQPKIAQNV